MVAWAATDIVWKWLWGPQPRIVLPPIHHIFDIHVILSDFLAMISSQFYSVYNSFLFAIRFQEGSLIS